MAKICPNCKASLPDNIKFCTECGAAVPAAEPVIRQTAPQSIPQTPPVKAATPPPVVTPPPVTAAAPAVNGEYIPTKGSKYDPITTKGFIGIGLLMCIPVIGIVLTIVWACGGCKKINKRNLARASLIMMAIGLVFSLIFSIAVKAIISSAVEQVEQESGISVSALLNGKEENSAAAESSDIASLLGGIASLSGEGESTASESDLGELASLLGGIAALSGEGNSGVTNQDIEELQELQGILEGLEGVTGENGESTAGLDALLEGAIAANQDAEAANDGWPSSLRKYPGGTAAAVASYRTEISSTSLEEMLAWIENLKKDGFAYKDFYDFGMSEEDMLSMNGWWATDGNIYLSVSYYDGIVTVDHTKELPDLSSYFG